MPCRLPVQGLPLSRGLRVADVCYPSVPPVTVASSHHRRGLSNFKDLVHSGWLFPSHILVRTDCVTLREVAVRLGACAAGVTLCHPSAHLACSRYGEPSWLPCAASSRCDASCPYSARGPSLVERLGHRPRCRFTRSAFLRLSLDGAFQHQISNLPLGATTHRRNLPRSQRASN